MERGAIDLDGFDRRLLEALQRNNRQTGEELAEVVGLSPAACLRRAQRLRDMGFIAHDVSLISPEAVGRGLTVIVMVTQQRDPSGRIDVPQRFIDRMLQAPEVTQCYSVTGPADYVVIVHIASMEDYQDFVRRHFHDTHIKRFETFVSMGRLKFETAMPVAGAS
jgi:Lrp/AsnC family leucine-responsive transcriptional regulator